MFMFQFIIIIIIIVSVLKFIKKKNKIDNTIPKYRNQVYDNINKIHQINQNNNYVRNTTSTVKNDNINTNNYEEKESDIGYIKCQKCGTFNSKKHDKCFMCGETIK